MQDNEEYVRAPKAAQFLGISLRQLYNLRDAGKIPHVKLSTRCVLYSLPEIRQTLQRLRINAIGGAS